VQDCYWKFNYNIYEILSKSTDDQRTFYTQTSRCGWRNSRVIFINSETFLVFDPLQCAFVYRWTDWHLFVFFFFFFNCVWVHYCSVQYGKAFNNFRRKKGNRGGDSWGRCSFVQYVLYTYVLTKITRRAIKMSSRIDDRHTGCIDSETVFIIL